MPDKGDKVKVVLEGEYSHQGATDLGKRGRHIVVIDGGEYSVPKDAKFEVTEKYVAPEPTSDVIVIELDTARIWRPCCGGGCGGWESSGGGEWDSRTWHQLYLDTNGRLDYYRKTDMPAEEIVRLKMPLYYTFGRAA